MARKKKEATPKPEPDHARAGQIWAILLTRQDKLGGTIQIMDRFGGAVANVRAAMTFELRGEAEKFAKAHRGSEDLAGLTRIVAEIPDPRRVVALAAEVTTP